MSADSDPTGEVALDDRRVQQSAAGERARARFALTGPLDRSHSPALPMRGDLAHIALAGRFFVPYYAVPQPRAVMPGGAIVHSAPDAQSPQLAQLLEGDSFELLDIVGQWAWGCLTVEGPTGYLHIDRLEALP